MHPASILKTNHHITSSMKVRPFHFFFFLFTAISTFIGYFMPKTSFKRTVEVLFNLESREYFSIVFSVSSFVN